MKINLFPSVNSNIKTIIAFVGVFVIGSFINHLLLPAINIESKRLIYLHYHFIEVLLNGKNEAIANNNLKAYVYKDGERITTIGDQECMTFRYDSENKQYCGRFPVPWGAPEGIYTIKLQDGEDNIGWEEVVYIKSRVPGVKFNRPLKIMNLESMKRVNSIKAVSPLGIKKDFHAIFDWIKYIGGNTLWYIAGQTSSYKEGDLREDFPWVKDNFDTLKEFSLNAKKNNVDFGAWISCFLTFGNSSLKPKWYTYSYNYKGGKVVKSDGISILDNRRVEDILKYARELCKIETIDYIGLDYIRPASGGLELVDEFISSMDVEVPENWTDLSKMAKMSWLGKIVTRTSDRKIPLIDKWNWWRAHRVSKIIQYIKENLRTEKPLWTFILSWELGHQHGQDPVMFQDAGADLIAVMMYETDAPRFENIINDWRDYLRDHNINIVVGNQIDWPLHQYSVDPAGPAEYARRINRCIDEISNLKGIFINDFARAMWGRKGPYGTMEWLVAAAGSFTKLSEKSAPLNVRIIVPEKINENEQFTGNVSVKNFADKTIKNIMIEFPKLSGVTINCDKQKINELRPGDGKNIEFTAKVSGMPDYRLGRYMINACVKHDENVYYDYKYLWAKGIVLDLGKNYR